MLIFPKGYNNTSIITCQFDIHQIKLVENMNSSTNGCHNLIRSRPGYGNFKSPTAKNFERQQKHTSNEVKKIIPHLDREMRNKHNIGIETIESIPKMCLIRNCFRSCW